MKKLLIVLITAIVILALVVLANYIMQRATADKAAEMIARVMEDRGYDYEYKRAYLNPLTDTIYVEELLIDNLFVSHVKISGLQEGDEEITLTADLRGIDFTESRRDYVRIEKLKLNELTLVFEYEEWVPYSVEKLTMENLKLRSYEDAISIGSADIDGRLRIPTTSDYTVLLENIDYNAEINNISLTLDKLPIEIASLSLESSSDKDGNYLQSFAIDGELFSLNGSTSGTVTDDRFLLSDFNISYEDKSLVDYIIAAMEKESEQSGLREDMINELEYEDYDEFIDGDTLKALVVDFINNPNRIMLTGSVGDGEPFDVYDIMTGNVETLPDRMEIVLTVNANSPFQIKRNPDHYPYEPEPTLGGMIVDFESTRSRSCTFISHRADDDYPSTFYCSSDILSFIDEAIAVGGMENEAGPFYIEYNSDRKITYIDFADGYEDWGGEAEEYEEAEEGADIPENNAGGLHLNFIKADYDNKYDEYLCNFISETNSSEHILYCDSVDVEYFEEREGPFYVEFDYSDTITGYSVDWQDYEEWYAEDY